MSRDSAERPDGTATDRASFYGSLPAGGQFYRRSGARLGEDPDDAIHQVSQTPDELHRGFHRFDKAHVVMLVERGLVPREIGTSLLTGLLALEEEGIVETRRDGKHGCHGGEAYLIDALGEDIGGWIHVGRSTHDLVETAHRIVLREKLLTLTEATLDLLEAYTEKAATYDDAPMPTYTGYQHAQVATFGYHLMAWEHSVERDAERLLACYERLNRSSAGAAVGTTTDFDIDRERVADLLGFDGVLSNGEDVDKGADVDLEYSSLLAILLSDVTAAADNLLLWFSREFDLIDVPDRFCGTSSIMPQKRNPHAIEAVQRTVDDVVGDVTGGFVGSKNIGGHPETSLATVDRTTWAVRTWATLVSNLSFDRDRGEELVYEEWALATDLAAAIVRHADVSWREAHQVVAILVRQATESNSGVTGLTTEDVDAAAMAYLGEPVSLSQETIDHVLTAERALADRSDVTGSPAPAQVRTQVEDATDAIDDYRTQVETHRDRLDSADDRLAAAVNDLVSAE